MNYQWDTELHLLRRESAPNWAISDGSEVDDRIYDALRKTTDRSTFSPELAGLITDAVTEYAFSRARHCIVRPLGIQAGDKILEFGCGYGAVTRYLGEIGAQVVGVEGRIGQARSAAERCRELTNVRIVADDLFRFDTDELFDWVLLFDVLEYAAMFSDEDNPYMRYLRSVSRFLNPGGRVVIATENKLGLKYFNGCGEDHVKLPFFGIQDLYGDRTVRTFGRKQLIAELSAGGLPYLHFYYPFPDHKLPSVILSDDALSDREFDPVDLLARSHARDYSGSALRGFDDALAFSALHDNGLLAYLSNSFLVVATAEPSLRKNAAEIAVAFSTSNRAPEFATQTRFVRQGPKLRVLKESLTASACPRVSTGQITFWNKLEDADYSPGRQILWRLLKARADAGDLNAVVRALQPWAEFLLKNARVPTAHAARASMRAPSLASYMLPGDFLDCTPFNVLDTGHGLVVIDTEWTTDHDIPLGWVVSRGIMWSLISGVPAANHLQSVVEVIQALCDKLGLVVSAADLGCWMSQEARFQAVVVGHPPEELVLTRTSSGLRSFTSEISGLTESVSVRDGQIANLNRTVMVQDDRLAALNEAAVARDQQIAGLNHSVAVRDEQITTLNQAAVARDEQIANLNRAADTMEAEIVTLKQAVANAQTEISDLRQSAVNREDELARRGTRIKALELRLQETNTKLRSISWKLAAPLHRISTTFPQVAGMLRSTARGTYWVLSLQLPDRLRRRKIARMLLASGLFDPTFYLSQYKDVADSGVNPLEHYILVGTTEGRKPNLYFDTAYYLQKNPDVAASGVNPLLHYLVDGFKEGRDPSAEFKRRLSRTQKPELLSAGVNPLSHLLKYGEIDSTLLPQVAADGRDLVADLQAPVALNDPYQRAEIMLRSRDSRRRILVIDAGIPTPDLDSGSVRMFGIIRLLAGLHVEVTFASHKPDNDAAYVAAVRQIGVDVLQGEKEIRAHLAQRGSAYSLVMVSRPEMADIYLTVVRAYAAQADLVYDCVDLHYLRFRRGAQLTGDREMAKCAEHYCRLETTAFKFSDRVIAITDTEKDAILEMWPTVKVGVIPNIHSLDISSNGWSDRKNLLFIGGYDHQPNVDAVMWFAQDILPLIVDKIPNLKLTLLGSKAPQSVKSLARDNVEVVGWVPDPRPYFAASRVFVSPLRYGAGMKGKIGQALSLGLPVVTTSIGAEGMHLVDGVHALIADSPEDFAVAVIRLYNDEILWKRMQRESALHLEQNFSEAAVQTILKQLFIGNSNSTDIRIGTQA